MTFQPIELESCLNLLKLRERLVQQKKKLESFETFQFF